MKKQNTKVQKADLDLDQALKEIAKSLRPVAARGEEEEYASGQNGSCHDSSGSNTYAGH